jgi:2-phosphosulfolactate phosphatase
MSQMVVIDSLPDNVCLYRDGWAIVTVDVIRATTTAVTAVATGRRCFPVPTIQAALALAEQFDDPLLAGESKGTIPTGFEVDNSPAALICRTDTRRPLVLVSSSGTKVIHEAAGCEASYLGCFRNYSVLVDHLAKHHSRVAIIGAGSRGEFREEDQICCAWIAAGLMRKGYLPENTQTALITSRWQEAPAEACLCSRSVDFLIRTGRLKDLYFILSHIDDLRAVFSVHGGEVKMSLAEPPLAISSLVYAGPQRTAGVPPEF